tara:strand:+ start:3031 stop:3591 length:561 start_codon:yes stop_codon:yes gene_type:complete
MLNKYEFEFLKSFPFDEYEMTCGEEAISSETGLDIEPEKSMLYNFTYPVPQSEVTISFYEEDICFLYEISSNISILDSVRKHIDLGLKSESILYKMKCIKKTRPFLNKIETPSNTKDLFVSVLEGIQRINTINLPDTMLKDTIKLKEGIDLDSMRSGEERIISSYLNFQLHHAKIMLGIVIASKIH